jgi:hypothetical protein
MKSLNGLLFIVAGGLIIWIGATGRLPALAAALGMIKNAPPGGGSGSKTAASPAPVAANFGDVKSGSSSSSAPTPAQGMKDAGSNFWNNTVGPYATVLGLK